MARYEPPGVRRTVSGSALLVDLISLVTACAIGADSRLMHALVWYERRAIPRLFQFLATSIERRKGRTMPQSVIRNCCTASAAASDAPNFVIPDDDVASKAIGNVRSEINDLWHALTVTAKKTARLDPSPAVSVDQTNGRTILVGLEAACHWLVVRAETNVRQQLFATSKR
jgi:hypothetical protein